eukprot:CAMPEP_0194564682 /NCGR_PEP_ID=MMETSP0292-20121207/4237_1 /TAXON_ID=39354 /ORGANISM="Heterosigma akashiwo, Strain CCMP2393" /LENGTH=165 /DNA_ID=CAMNT_0039413855 /DNA_START=213 /DNA_END=708 /DNA_ORIENTATION=-
MAALCKRYMFLALTLLWLPYCLADNRGIRPVPPAIHSKTPESLAAAKKIQQHQRNTPVPPAIHSKTPESLAAAKKIQQHLNEHTKAMPKSDREEPSDDDDETSPGFSFHLHKLHPHDSHRPATSEARNPPVPATLPSKPPEMPSILHPQQPEPEERDESWLNPMW